MDRGELSLSQRNTDRGELSLSLVGLDSTITDSPTIYLDLLTNQP